MFSTPILFDIKVMKGAFRDFLNQQVFGNPLKIPSYHFPLVSNNAEKKNHSKTIQATYMDY
jgi:hypothetical protein